MLFQTLIAVLFLSLILAGCDNKETEQAELELKMQDSIRVADSLAQAERNQEIERMRVEREKMLEAGDTFGPEMSNDTLDAKIKEGKVFLLSEEGETIPFRFEGSKIMAVTMPDGKLYQVEKDGDKTMLMIPNQGKMERRVVNGKIYLVDDAGQLYEVKVINKKLVAVLDDGTEVNLAERENSKENY